MSFQAYLDAVENQTGKTPDELLAEASPLGFGPDTKAAVVVTSLKNEYGVRHGHAMAFFSVLRNGATISDGHVGTTGSHRDESTALRLDGTVHRNGVRR